MSAQVIPIRKAEPAFRAATALRRFGLVRIAPSNWTTGTASFGTGRFVAVHPDAADPDSLLLFEIARQVCRGAPRRGALPPRTESAAVAGLVRARAGRRVPDLATLSVLEGLGTTERVRLKALADRIFEAGLERPATTGRTWAAHAGRRFRGKPGRKSRSGQGPGHDRR